MLEWLFAYISVTLAFVRETETSAESLLKDNESWFIQKKWGTYHDTLHFVMLSKFEFLVMFFIFQFPCFNKELIKQLACKIWRCICWWEFIRWTNPNIVEKWSKLGWFLNSKESSMNQGWLNIWEMRHEGRPTTTSGPLQMTQDTISKHLDFDASFTFFSGLVKSWRVFISLPLTFA